MQTRSCEDSFDGIAERLKGADEDAAREVFTRFARQLIGLARSHLDAAVKIRVDPLDITQSVFRSFFRRQQADEFELESWDGLWALLARIAIRKCRRQNAAHRAAKRDVRREIRDVEAAPFGSLLSSVKNRDPRPDEVAALNEILTKLLECAPPEKREWLVLRLQGYTVEEISNQVGRTQRSVYRFLKKIRVEATRMELDALAVAYV